MQAGHVLARCRRASPRRRTSSPSPFVSARSSAVDAVALDARPRASSASTFSNGRVVVGPPAGGLDRDLEVAFGDALRLFGAHQLAVRLRPALPARRAAGCEYSSSRLSWSKSVPAHAVELVDDTGRARRAPVRSRSRARSAPRCVGRERGLRGALLLGGRGAARARGAGPTRCARPRCGPTASSSSSARSWPARPAAPLRRRGGCGGRAPRPRPGACVAPRSRRRARRRPATGWTVSTGAGGNGGAARSASISSRQQLARTSGLGSAGVGGRDRFGGRVTIRLILRRPDPGHLTASSREILWPGPFRRRSAPLPGQRLLGDRRHVHAVRSKTRAKASPRPSATPPPRSS